MSDREHLRLAIDGGSPVRETLLPYALPHIEEADIERVVETLRSGWLTTGPALDEFERDFAQVAGAREAMAVSSGTAALHACMHAVEIGVGDEVIVPPITFAATANAILYQGGVPVFADVSPGTLLIDPNSIEERIGPQTRAILVVDYAGHPCEYGKIRKIADRAGIPLIADACHAVGGAYEGRPVGSLADLTAFSLHSLKHVAVGEGGVVTTNDPHLAQRVRHFRSHGITTDARQRELAGSWYYEMHDLGYNYRLSEIQCALAISQLRKLPASVVKRREFAEELNEGLRHITGVDPLEVSPGIKHAYHLYVVRVHPSLGRDRVFRALRAEGIGVNVHYLPVHLHPYYRERLETRPGDCPVAETAYEEILTLPLFPQMNSLDVRDILAAVDKVATAYAHEMDKRILPGEAL